MWQQMDKNKRDCFHNTLHVLTDNFEDAAIFNEVFLEAEINLGRLDGFKYEKIEL